MSIIQSMFKSINLGYFIRHYLFSLTLTILLYSISSTHASISFYIFLGLSFICYPFARMVYDTFIYFLMGDTIWIGTILFSMSLFIVKTGLLFILSSLLAPIGLLILLIASQRK